MNPFILVISALYIAAAGQEFALTSDFKSAIIYLCFGVANILIMLK